MNTEFWLDPTFSTRLCLMLVHSLWQMTLLTVIVWGLDRLWRRRSVERSYALHVAALIAGLAALPVTYALIDVSGPQWVVQSERSIRSQLAAAAHETPLVPRAPAAADVFEPPTGGSDAAFMTVPVAAPSSVPPATESVASDASASWQMAATWMVGLYALGVLMMLARLVRGLWYAHRLAAHAQPLNDGPVAELLQSLARQWSLRLTPALAVAERVVVPKVVGLLRPTILLPASAVTGLSSDELQMILAHELAHIRRHDLWVNLLQRLAETLLFFNPALWYLSRRVSTLREYCCDELTCRTMTPAAAGDPPPSEDSRPPLAVEPRTRYAAALLKVAELGRPTAGDSQPARTTQPNDLATLAAAGRSPSELRRRIAYLFGEPLREPLRLSRASLITTCGLLALLILSAIIWQPTADSAPPQEAETAKETRRFELIVHGPDGRPVPRATVEVRTKPAPTAEQVLVGEYVRPATYGPFVRTDAEGRLVLQLPEKQPRRLNLSIKTAGFGPYWADFSSDEHPQTIPSRFVAELEEAWSVGGVVVDELGTPIAGVQVGPSVKFKMRPGDIDVLGVGTRIKTDSAGKWRFDNVPASKSDVFVSFNHPDFMSQRRPLSRDGFGLAADKEPTAKIVLQRGLTATGRVTDENGEPIEGALLRTQFHNDIREARTDANGDYTLIGCEPRMAKIVVSAEGRATDMKEVRIDPDLQPVDFQMQPGGKVRIRVLDENGDPVPRARIFFQRWRGDRFDYFEFDHVDQYADQNGVWEWNEAPLDGFKADICQPDGMQLGEQPIVPREEAYVFRLPPALVISGRVIDKQTREPVNRFRVIPGVRSSETHMNWVRGNGFEATDGEYRLRHVHDYFAHLLRIEADGYSIAVSRDVKSNEGNVRIDFELTPASDIAATVLTPDGQLAADAKIALGVAGSQITVTNGDLDDGSTLGPRRDADEKGQFRFPAQNSAYQLVITHPSGFAYLKSAEQEIPSTILLTPWARVEGTFRVGPEPAANVELTLDTNTIHSYGKDVPNIFTHHEVTTGTDGRYVFERVVPGKGWVRRRILLMVDDGAVEVTSSMQVTAMFPAGETTTLDLGGDGRAVVGNLVPPRGAKQPVLWNFALVDAQVVGLPLPETPTPPADVQNDPEKQQAWWEEWKKTPEGKVWQFQYEAYENFREASPYFTATVDRDGTFRIDDVPAGNYTLSVRFSQHSAGRLSAHPFFVPDVDDIHSAPPLSLGELQLE